MVTDLLTIMARLKSGAVVAFVCIQGQSRSVLMARVVMEAMGVDAESACEDMMPLTSRSVGRYDSENLIHLRLVYLFVVGVTRSRCQWQHLLAARPFANVWDGQRASAKDVFKELLLELKKRLRELRFHC